MECIYASAIVLAVIIIILVFALIKKRHYAKLNEFKREKYAGISKTATNAVKEIEKTAEETKKNTQLEDFVFAEPQKEDEKLDEVEKVEKVERPRPIKLPTSQISEQEDDDEDVEIEDDKIDLTEDFKKYEEFLKENNINLDELDKIDDEEEDDSKFDEELKDLDLRIEDFAGKTDDEIREVVKKYPPHLQEIILKELLGDDE